MILDLLRPQFVGKHTLSNANMRNANSTISIKNKVLV